MIIDPALLTRPAADVAPQPPAIPESRIQAIEDRLLQLEARASGERAALYAITGCAVLGALIVIARRRFGKRD